MNSRECALLICDDRRADFSRNDRRTAAEDWDNEFWPPSLHIETCSSAPRRPKSGGVSQRFNRVHGQH